MISLARLRQWKADLLAAFWLRPSILTAGAVLLGHVLVQAEGKGRLPRWADGWIYAGSASGARDVLGVIAGSTIGVAGTVFSITVAALTLASSQMGPRLLRNFTRNAGNQYALGAFVATFAYTLVVLRSVRAAEEGAAFVPQIAVTVGLMLAFVCIGVLVWFLHHVAASINVAEVVALVAGDLTAMVEALPDREPAPAAAGGEAARDWDGAAELCAPGSGYLRVLDDEAAADWAATEDAFLELRVRPGTFVFPGSRIGRVLPAAKAAEAEAMLRGAMAFGRSRSAEQDPEYVVRQLVEMALRALSPSINDPFTAIAVVDELGAALCRLARRRLPDGVTLRDGVPRVVRAATDYDGLLDAMFHMLRQAASGEPAVMIRLLEVLAEVEAVETDPRRRHALRRHAQLAGEAAAAGTEDSSALEAIRRRRG